MSGRVLVVGSANVDLVVRVDRLPGEGETVTGGVFSRHGGGKGANQAVAAAQSGAAVTLVLPIGTDANGAETLAGLRSEGIKLAPVEFEDAPTGVACILVDSEGQNAIAVASGANALLSANQVEQRLGSLAPGIPDVLLLSNELPDEANECAARWARQQGAQVILNPAPARDLTASLAECATVLTPNRHEVRSLTGTEDPGAAAAAIRERTDATVVVSLGEEGALVVGPQGSRRFDAPVVTAVDTTGAGDVLNGALAAGLASGDGLDQALAWAVERASRSVADPGARFVRPRP